MTAISLDDEMQAALQPWDGKTWFVEKPAGFVPGLFRSSQVQARDILRHASGLTNWEAEVCQRAYYDPKPSGPGVRFWLDKIERKVCRAVSS
ncbi:hypothetical protein [Altererythrobacter sp. GH1-8]|uniref:hypothetical protein n=1 Tax=Altererythrobacter sp. GH1-8 TaxID=3349333 RepID=UPI00374D065D